ncbi:hypothetical protein [Amphritea japonica]|nr:hypothetical protein [Amphritea japonica]
MKHSTMESKPDTKEAMRNLIKDIRSGIPFDTPVAEMCNGPCTGCSKKLMDYLDMELEEKETLLATGHNPTLGEINRLKKTAIKIHGVLSQNGLVKTSNSPR